MPWLWLASVSSTKRSSNWANLNEASSERKEGRNLKPMLQSKDQTLPHGAVRRKPFHGSKDQPWTVWSWLWMHLDDLKSLGEAAGDVLAPSCCPAREYHRISIKKLHKHENMCFLQTQYDNQQARLMRSNLEHDFNILILLVYYIIEYHR